MDHSNSSIGSIENVILEYLRREKVKDAILLKGAWGSGKTYFLKNRIFQFINNEIQNSKLIYLSLFGVKNLENLKSNLIVELLPDEKYKDFLKQGGYSVAIKLITAKFNIDLANLLSSISFSKYLKDDTQYIFIFDDVERLHSDFGYRSFLGWINNFIEHNDIKTILIANENDIKDEDYNSYKEKVVGTTIKFNSEKAYADVINNYSDDPVLGNYVKKHKEIIDYLYEEGCSENLRTLEFGLNKLRYVFEVLENEIDPKANTKNIQEKLILITMSISFEYKIDEINDSNKKSIHYEDEYDIDLDIIFGTNSYRDTNGTEDLRTKLENKYFKRFGQSFTPINQVLDLVVDGTFNKELYKKRILQLAGLSKEKSEIVFQTVMNFKTADSTETLIDSTEEAIAFLDEPAYDLKHTLILMDIIFKISYKDLIDKEIQNLYDKFLSILESNSFEFEYFDTLEYQFEKTERPYGDYFTKIVGKAIEINNTALEKIKTEVKKSFFKELVENPSNFRSLVYELGHQNNPIFEAWDAKKTATYLTKAENETIIAFKNFIQSRYSGNQELYRQERDFLQDLITLIQKESKDLDKVKAYNLDGLIQQINTFESMFKENVKRKDSPNK